MKQNSPEKRLTRLFVDKHILANKLEGKQKREDQKRIMESGETKVLMLVGSGMGISAGLPDGWGTKEAIEENLVLQKRAKKLEKKLGKPPSLEAPRRGRGGLYF